MFQLNHLFYFLTADPPPIKLCGKGTEEVNITALVPPSSSSEMYIRFHSGPRTGSSSVRRFSITIRANSNGESQSLHSNFVKIIMLQWFLYISFSGKSSQPVLNVKNTYPSSQTHAPQACQPLYIFSKTSFNSSHSSSPWSSSYPFPNYNYSSIFLRIPLYLNQLPSC